MSRPVSALALQAMLAQETGEVFLACVTLTHPSFTSPYRLVYDYNTLTRAAGDFIPCAFEITLPSEVEDQIPQVTMTVDNVDRAIITAIRSLPAGVRVNVMLEVVLASQPDTIEAGPIDFKIMSTDFDAGKITGTLGFEDDVLSAGIPSATYTPVNSPGLFA